jgi:hypothetical protein
MEILKYRNKKGIGSTIIFIEKVYKYILGGLAEGFSIIFTQ